MGIRGLKGDKGAYGRPGTPGEPGNVYLKAHSTNLTARQKHWNLNV